MVVSTAELPRVLPETQVGSALKDPYLTYVALGGILDPELYQAVARCASTRDRKKFIPATEFQAKDFARRSGISLSAELLRFYGTLREVSFPVPKGKEKEVLELDRLSDTGVFAQALLLDHQPEAYRRFVSGYLSPKPHPGGGESYDEI